MKLGSKLTIISISLLFVVACQKSYSDQKDIGTDLHGTSTMYFYGESGFIVRGTCEDAKPALPAFCKNNPVKIAERQLKDSFILELQRQAKLVSDEVAPLEAQYALHDQNFIGLDASFTDSEKTLASLNTEGVLTTNDLDVFSKENNSIISAYETEKSRIDSALRSKPSDSDLLQEKIQVEEELSVLIKERTALVAKKDEYYNSSNGLIITASRSSSKFKSDRDQARAQMTLVEQKLSQSRKNQIAVLQKIDGIDVAIVKIKEGVRYTALKNNNHLLDLRPILEQFNLRFDEEQAKVTTPVVIDPTAPDSRVSLQNGLLMVMQNGSWSGVCDDNFDKADATVACRSLGKNFVSFLSGQQGPSGIFAIDEVSCTGSESTILSCKHAGLGVENCGSSEHVGLVCN